MKEMITSSLIKSCFSSLILLFKNVSLLLLQLLRLRFKYWFCFVLEKMEKYFVVLITSEKFCCEKKVFHTCLFFGVGVKRERTVTEQTNDTGFFTYLFHNNNFNLQFPMFEYFFLYFVSHITHFIFYLRYLQNLSSSYYPQPSTYISTRHDGMNICTKMFWNNRIITWTNHIFCFMSKRPRFK